MLGKKNRQTESRGCGDMKEDVSGGGKKEAIDLHRRLLPRAMKQPTISFFYLLS
jgi:hypothetical protein